MGTAKALARLCICIYGTKITFIGSFHFYIQGDYSTGTILAVVVVVVVVVLGLALFFNISKCIRTVSYSTSVSGRAPQHKKRSVQTRLVQ